VSYSKREIQWFLRLGKPRIKFDLWWAGKESFCDKGVQAVLEKLHPGIMNYPKDEFKAYPIKAWSAADSFSLGRAQINWMQLHPFAQHDPAWTLELLSAVIAYRQEAARSIVEPHTALEQMQVWRTKRYLAETSTRRYSHAKVVKHNTMIKRMKEEWMTNLNALVHKPSLVKPDKMDGCGFPLPISETPRGLKAYMDGVPKKERLTSNQGTYRGAVLAENNRRICIMTHWAECWIAHLKPEKALVKS
jgi:hypothetical protein